jgi:hypothetical protein
MFKYLNIEILWKRRNGISTLPTILLLGSIIIEIAIAIAFLTYYFNLSNFATRLSAEALATARAGMDDGIIRLVRDKNFSSAGYTVTVGNRTANVEVCNVTCPGLATNQAKVTSVATALNKKKKLEAVLTVDSVTGQVTVNSIQDVPI